MNKNSLSRQTLFLTLLALMAFAANSVLCRMALSGGMIDPAGFTTVRLSAGALALVLLVTVTGSKQPKLTLKPEKANFCGALALFIYALLFSVAYVQLETGAGALVLFGAVQLTLLCASIMQGNYPRTVELIGAVIAFSGLVFLLYPTWGSPTLLAFVLMLLSGVAWGLYTWIGKHSVRPVEDTKMAFLASLPLLIILNIFYFEPDQWTTGGVILAAFSGALSSALGYALWYFVLPKLSAMQAGVVQLLVPVIAAVGGVVFINEGFTQRLLVATALVLGGVYWVLQAQNRSR